MQTDLGITSSFFDSYSMKQITSYFTLHFYNVLYSLCCAYGVVRLPAAKYTQNQITFDRKHIFSFFFLMNFTKICFIFIFTFCSSWGTQAHKFCHLCPNDMLSGYAHVLINKQYRLNPCVQLKILQPTKCFRACFSFHINK